MGAGVSPTAASGKRSFGASQRVWPARGFTAGDALGRAPALPWCWFSPALLRLFQGGLTSSYFISCGSMGGSRGHLNVLREKHPIFGQIREVKLLGTAAKAQLSLLPTPRSI